MADANRDRARPFVSVVIPAFNAASYIESALASVFAQTYTDYEVIVVNDGSPDSDELQRVIEPLRPRVQYVSQEHRGVSAARNAGIRLARGILYAQLDADDQWLPEYLEHQVAFLAANPDVDLVYPNATFFGQPEDEGMDFMTLCPSTGEASFAALLDQRCVVMTSVTARLESIRDSGMFDESLPTCEDFDLWLRLAYRGHRIAYHQRPLVRYRRSSTSLSADRVVMTESQLFVLEKVRRSMSLTPAQQASLEAGVRRCAMELSLLKGRRALRRGDVDEAIQHLTKAIEIRSSMPLRIARFLLQYSPSLFRSALRIRRGLRSVFAKSSLPQA